ncbi:hypothetical protein ABBQ38_014952 [Trebouxia sp. C0009 RCD-2024]
MATPLLKLALFLHPRYRVVGIGKDDFKEIVNQLSTLAHLQAPACQMLQGRKRGRLEITEQSESEVRKQKLRRDIRATDAQVLDLTDTEKYKQMNSQLPSADLRNLSATCNEVGQGGFDDVHIDDSPEELMKFFEADQAH